MTEAERRLLLASAVVVAALCSRAGMEGVMKDLNELIKKVEAEGELQR